MMTRDVRPIVAGNVASQKRNQRFPHASNSPLTVGLSFLTELDSDDDEPQIESDAGEPHQPPRIAQWRSNLIALSQTDNLYFAAYEEKIHVTIPQGLKQTIHRQPDLIIDLPRSKDAIRIGGYLDRLHGHSVNHIIVGNVGALEIILVACDDGDVIAYYTHNIQAAVKAPGSQSSIRPFFHENVGISVWGLAIHSKSRMIAVSSNNREVVVFHFGCTETSTSSNTTTRETSDDGFLFTFSDQIHLSESNSTLFPTAGDLTNRGNSFRRIFKLGPEGHNIPSIDFANDSDGDAHSILAMDINGNLWILDIWRDGNPDGLIRRIPSSYKTSTRPGNNIMGWGVLALPLHTFKHTATPEQALGTDTSPLETICKPHQGTAFKRHFMFDISDTLTEVDVGNKSRYHPLYGYGIGGPDTTPTLPNIGLTGGLGSLTSSQRLGSPSLQKPLLNTFLDTSGRRFEALINTSEMEKNSYMNRETLLSREGRPKMVNSEPEQLNPPVYYLQDKCAILRTYQDDIELIPPTDTMPTTICRKALRQDLPMAIVHQINFERLIFQILIAELGLVIVGSQVGRVALISLTRPEDTFSHHGPVTMFRVEHILPTYTHEIQGFRPAVPLLGVAVSPLQGQQKGRKRWRMIMQYYDHSILSYELSRDEDELLVL